MEVTNRFVVIKTHVDGSPSEDDFELKSEVVCLDLEPGSLNVVVKNLYVSIDPYQVNRMKTQSSSQSLVNLASSTIPGQVGPSGHVQYKFSEGHNSYVVGCTGSKEKVAMLTEELGFDAGFNYKEVTDLKETLNSYFPDGIDIYFDNVGGEMQEAAIENMKIFGRVAVCGVISHYTDKEKKAAPNMMDIVYRRINLRGFLTIDFLGMFPEFVKTTAGYLESGKMKSIEDISKGVESIPSAFIGLFQGKNVGKKIVQIAENE